ncbi:uncharacterized protein L969DRAFT_93399 [Mixia osmundae IAM 14324]|uniref:Glycoside hydrolase 131 catalytic N-terminal domain-containing protein n=1 Tax=Mixia osmundae (strain CBS 9802 / IAM 14324 / JCM 22182 / KY 12970) TaxID=764103 RepID=G7EAP8_MIXOS|nr:uncharacterized protein L969DRAFT_93399 [Mixia osmundae IAM 14324]KEI40877.1 hypothetical protein L969DRAFT_93399 [Mixia osmundae IAM 14324]GAA99908.1 hypothetical protein E5Q_06611 [Mixia osmundae IAM 14324]
MFANKTAFLSAATAIAFGVFAAASPIAPSAAASLATSTNLLVERQSTRHRLHIQLAAIQGDIDFVYSPQAGKFTQIVPTQFLHPSISETNSEYLVVSFMAHVEHIVHATFRFNLRGTEAYDFNIESGTFGDGPLNVSDVYIEWDGTPIRYSPTMP